MEENLIGFTVAKLAKEKGFDWNCTWFYERDNTTPTYFGLHKVHNLLKSCPTQSLLQCWLREVYKIHITTDSIYNEEDTEVEHYELMVFTNNKSKIDELLDRLSGSYDKYKTYELALEEGLQIALNLIK